MRYEPMTKAHTAASREPVQPAAHSTTNSTIGATIRYGFHGSRKVPTPRHRQNRPMAAAAHNAASGPTRRQMTATAATRQAALRTAAPR